jgi:hypothetical protein
MKNQKIKIKSSKSDRKGDIHHRSCETFNQLAIKVEQHGLTASKERVIEYVQTYGSEPFSFTCTEDAKKMIIIIN